MSSSEKSKSIENQRRKILVIPDAETTRERMGLIVRTLQTVGNQFIIKLLSEKTTAAELESLMESYSDPIVFLPWKKYFQFSNLDSKLGLHRTQGPLLIGYTSQALSPEVNPLDPQCVRIIVMDLHSTRPEEIHTLIKTLSKPESRFGITPLFRPNTSIYTHTWRKSDQLGGHLDTLSQLPEIQSHSHWKLQMNRIRCSLASLWSLYFDEGPGRIAFGQSETASFSKVFFQTALDSQLFAIRFCLQAPGWASKPLLDALWQRGPQEWNGFQILRQLCDFIRVRPVLDNAEVEFVLGFFASQPAMTSPLAPRTLWVEPISAHQALDPPYEVTSETLRGRVPFPLTVSTHQKKAPVPVESPSTAYSQLETPTDIPFAEVFSIQIQAKDLAIKSASQQIRTLKKTMQEQGLLIQELKLGGVGSAAPPPPPETQDLISTFKTRLTELDHQLDGLKEQMQGLELGSDPPEKIDSLQSEIDHLASLQAQWVNELQQIITEQYGKLSRNKNRRLRKTGT